MEEHTISIREVLTITIKGISQDLVHIQEGVHDFWILDTPVTQAFYAAVMGHNPSHFSGRANNPVENVSWDDCQAFVKKLNAFMPNYHFSLPTESQWQIACGPDPEDIEEYAWTSCNSNNTTQPVKQKKPNHHGIYDMLGNVWEWCEDVY